MAWGSLAIAGQRIPAGETRTIRIQISESYTSVPVYMPITVIRGTSAGPTVAAMAALHGDELVGMEIVRQCLNQLEGRDISGTLICIPVVNVLGFQNQSRYLPDGRDLNRCFPGKARGSPASRMAHVIFTEVMSLCDFGIDFHTAGNGRINIPHVRSDLASGKVMDIAMSFGPRLIMQTQGERGMLRMAAAKQGIPVITYEAGEPLRFDSAIARAGVRGVFNVLSTLGVLDEPRESPDCQLIAQHGIWIRAERGGILIPLVVPGQLVRRGEEIARNTNPFGKEHSVIKTPRTGLVVSLRTLPMVNPGDPVVHLVPIDDNEWDVAARAFPQTETGPVVF